MAPIHSSIPSSIENGHRTADSSAWSLKEDTLNSIRSPQLLSDPSTSTHHRREQMVSIPNTYGEMDSSPEPGVVAGIVLGTVGGVIIVLYLIYTVFGLGPARVVEEEVRRGSRSRSRSPYRERSEMSEVTRSRSRTPIPRSHSRRDRIIVEESSFTGPSSMDEDDVVEVFEEHSPSPPPRRGGRHSSGYRTVDPDEYGGGGRPTRHVRR
ncbi:hypothetical protein FQN54_000125 [Arachnomyces sp. PD_36]|nr:hypothetical protein FQN54_000125 [Arachnomyces sp. PD_36]